ncbi:MAG: HIRAN domain-containing protein [Eubacteriales bacterium]
MKQRFIAITGCNHYYGMKVLKPGTVIRLAKDPDNEFDTEAIMAVIDPIGQVGYVANSIHTVPMGCQSAGRIYDTFDNSIYAIVHFVTKDVAIAEVIYKDVHVEVIIKEEMTKSSNIPETIIPRPEDKTINLLYFSLCKRQKCHLYQLHFACEHFLRALKADRFL